MIEAFYLTRNGRMRMDNEIIFIDENTPLNELGKAWAADLSVIGEPLKLTHIICNNSKCCRDTIGGLTNIVADTYFFKDHYEDRKILKWLHHLEEVATPHRVLLCLQIFQINFLANMYYNDYDKVKEWSAYHQLFKLK